MSALKSILSLTDQLLIKLIENIEIHDQISFKNLQRILSIDSKTLRQLINKGNQLFYPIQINRNTENKLVLSIPNNHTVKFCYSMILKNSLVFNILESIFFNENYSILTLSQKLFISESTLRRAIHKINSVLVAQDFEIQTSPLKIRGNETRICNFIIYYYAERYSDYHQYFEEKFNPSKIAFVDHLVKLHFKMTHTKINYPDSEKAKLWLLVAFERIKLRKETTSKRRHNTEKTYNSFLNNFYMELKRNFNIEVRGNLYFLFVRQVYKKTFLNSKRKHLLNYDYSDRTLCLELLSNIQNDLSITAPNNKEQLLEVLLASLDLQYGPTFVLFDKYELFIKQFNIEYPEVTTTILNKIEQIFKPIIHEQYQIYNIAYIIITHWENLILSINPKKFRIKLALVFNSDIEHMNFLKILIEEEFPRRFDIQIITEFSNLNELDFSRLPYSLFITNIENLTIKNKDVYCMDFFLTKKDRDFLSKYTVTH